MRQLLFSQAWLDARLTKKCTQQITWVSSLGRWLRQIGTDERRRVNHEQTSPRSFLWVQRTIHSTGSLNQCRGVAVRWRNQKESLHLLGSCHISLSRQNLPQRSIVWPIRAPVAFAFKMTNAAFEPNGSPHQRDRVVPLVILYRLASNRNQTRRSVSSIQFSSRLAVATSPASSQVPCASRIRKANSRLSSRSSASMVCGST